MLKAPIDTCKSALKRANWQCSLPFLRTCAQAQEGNGPAEMAALEAVIKSHIAELRQLFSKAAQRVALPALWSAAEAPHSHALPDVGESCHLP